MNEREDGILKVYDQVKGFGFIQRSKGKDVFVHYSDFLDNDARVVEGGKLSFVVERTEKGVRARQVRAVM